MLVFGISWPREGGLEYYCGDGLGRGIFLKTEFLFLKKFFRYFSKVLFLERFVGEIFLHCVGTDTRRQMVRQSLLLMSGSGVFESVPVYKKAVDFKFTFASCFAKKFMNLDFGF